MVENSDGINADIQKKISVHPILGPENAQQRVQQAIDKYVEDNPDAQIAVIPQGPYTMLRRTQIIMSNNFEKLECRNHIFRHIPIFRPLPHFHLLVI